MAPNKDTGASASRSNPSAPKKGTGTSTSGSNTSAPKKGTGTSASGSKTSAPAGQGTGVKRPAPGNASATGSTPATGSTSATDRGTMVDVLLQDLVRVIIADIYHIGWQRFNHAETKRHLLHLGRECATAWTSSVNRVRYSNYTWPGDVRNMPTYLDNYLKGLRALTPAIVKRAMKPSERTYALCQPKETYNGDLDSVTATRDLFELELYDHKHEDNRYQGLRMLGAACIFHELVHGFVFSIMGPYSDGMEKVGTPPEFRAAWSQGDELDLEAAMGESGFYMEDIIFGGTVEMSPWLQPLAAKSASKLTCVNENGRKIEIPAEIAKAFNKDPKGYDIKKSITDVFKSAAPTQVPSQGRPAKRQKINPNVKPGSKARMHAWHLEFQYNSDHSAVTGLNKTTAPPA
ncbi:hypothetical protein F5883DRAFT_656930 [Diaporthe sp. PMI_573]|nr:hypothetical protein F5883DRAFT_656930 [Diaporthaceae sp. PMI_573]